MKNLLALTMVTVMLPACVINHGDFTVLSNKLFKTTDLHLENAPRQRDVEGTDVAHIICVIPTKVNPSVEAAVDDALMAGNGDVMVNARIESWFFYIPYIYGQEGWSVRGDVIRTQRR
jgi:hypothetical protein